VFNERGGVPVAQALAGISTSAAIIAIIGPEGGWSDPELDLLTHSGSTSVTLGRRVLRTETAAIVALTLIQHLVGDLSV
jgi:16S rRNA (uracil1498-N3)-methyltransferase